ncbi:glycosyltransferase family 39 protein [Candidatus Woesearchaeota archaeon]|nr:glycosyltransferase family 39 protein [Candidatus Woesearchaeota archaeon]
MITVTAPFLNRALAIDDIYIDSIADQLNKKPLDPYGFEWYMQNRNLTSAIIYTSPPLVSYYYASIQYFFGKNEFILHAFFIVFGITAAVSIYYFSKKFTRWNMVAALLLISTPMFAITSHNFMHDLPVMALFLLSVMTFANGVDRDDKLLLILSGLLAALTFFTKYNSIILFPLIAIYAFLRKKMRYGLYLAVPIFLTLIWFANEWYHYGKVHVIRFFLGWHVTKEVSAGLVGKFLESIIPFAVSNLSQIGGTTIFFIFLVYPFMKQRKDSVLLFALALINSLFAVLLYFKSSSFISGQYTVFQLILLVIFMTSSLFFIIKLTQFIAKPLYSTIKNNKYDETNANKLFLGAWFFLGLIFHTFVAGGTARYLVIILPPFILLFLMMAEEYAGKFKAKTGHIAYMFAAVIVLNIIVSMAASIADYQYAAVYRDFAQNVPLRYAESNIIFTGHEGFKYYMEREGYTFYDPYRRKLQQGDILIVPKIPVPRSLENEKNNLVLLDRIEYNSHFPLRTNNPWAHAGFYSYVNGLLPFSFSNKPLEIFEVYRFE